MRPSLISLVSAQALRCLTVLALAVPMATSAQSLLTKLTSTTVVQTDQVRAELMAHAPEGVEPGKVAWLGLQLTHSPEWHTYWKNSGDSGLPTTLEWTFPPGVTAGPIDWPAPRKFPIGPLANYGFSGTVLLPVPLSVDASFKGDAIDVKLHAAWLVCRKECIPEEGNFSLSLPTKVSTAVNGLAFGSAFGAAPTDLAAGNSSVQPLPQHLQVQLANLPPAWRGKPLEFFPETPGLIEPGAPWTQAWTGDRWEAKVPLTAYRNESPATLPLVVALANPPGEGTGGEAMRLEVAVQGAWPEAAPLPSALPDALTAALQANAARAAAESTGGANTPTSGNSGVPIALWAALLGALIGGALLNLMPCVFPVLAIKVLAFAKHADDRAAHRAHGLAYTAGVVLSFLALGALLLSLRAAGEQLGWGFHLQSPAVVALLATLFTLLGLNLAGLFEFGSVLPSSVATLQAKNPSVDAFLTGVLASAIASPCTAPFMGASLGLAIALPTPQALAVFGALGLGMALPYLAASWWPAIAKALPRPGAWMNTFRQLMAFPMFATVVWLLWVLGQQSGIDGAASLLMMLVALSWLVWALKLPRGTGRNTLVGVALVGLMGLGWAVGGNVTQAHAQATPNSTVATPGDPDASNWEPWSAARQTALIAEGRPVFVDFTAAWCVTCQFNKRTTLADADVLADLSQKNVAMLRADWTRRDPAVTEALAALGRNGVPVYVLHQSGQAPVVMSEILSVSDMRNALARL